MTMIYCDNQSRIKLLENSTFHERSKYIEIKYHFIKDMVLRGVVRLQHISTAEQVVDILTNMLPNTNFLFFREELGLQENVSLPRREHC